jgi:hypothetical protein
MPDYPGWGIIISLLQDIGKISRYNRLFGDIMTIQAVFSAGAHVKLIII